MENQENVQQIISSFLDRFQPNSEREVAILREIQQGLASGQPLEDQYHNFIALGDAELLRSFYEVFPAFRAQILANSNCPADLKSNPSSGHNHPLLALDYEIDLDLKGLADYEASLPDGEIDGPAKAGCEVRIQNLKGLFDRVPAVLHETDLTNNEDLLFYDLLMAKQRISTNQKLFSKLRIALFNRFAKSEPEREEDPERSLLDQTPQTDSQEEEPDTEPKELPDEDLEKEALAAMLAEEEAKAELEAKAEKKAENQKRQQRLREQAKAQEERSLQEQRRRESESYQESMHSSGYVPEPQLYHDQTEVLKRQEDRQRDEVLQDIERQRSENRAQQEENLHTYQERMEETRSYESFGKNHIDFSGKEQHGSDAATGYDRPAEPPHVESPAEPSPHSRSANPQSQEYAHPPHPQASYNERTEWERKRQEYKEDVVTREREQHEQALRERRDQAVENYTTRMDRSYEYQSFGNGHIDFSGKEQHGTGDTQPTEPPQHPHNEPASAATGTHDRPQSQSPSGPAPYSQSADREPHARPDHDYRYARPEYPDKGSHITPVYQPYMYAPGGTVTPAFDASDSHVSRLNNQEIYQAAAARGTITPEQSRAMRDNLMELRREYESAKDTPSHPEAARRYKEARDAIQAVNRDIRSHQIAFDHGTVPAANSANVAPTRRTEQPNGYTLYQYTPTGVQGKSYSDNTAKGGGVVIHNAPGTAGKAVLSPEKPLLVTKAYEESLYRDAQFAKTQLKDKTGVLDTSGSPMKLSAAELTAYKTALDAYEGFRRAKADGLVQITAAAGAQNTPDQIAWAARQETYRQTVEQHQQRRERRIANDGPSPSPDTPGHRRTSSDSAQSNQRIDPNPKPDDSKGPKPMPRSNESHDPRPRPRPNDSPDPKPRPKPNDPPDPKPRPKPNDPDTPDGGPRRWNERWDPTWRRAPFGSVFSIHYNRGKYTTGEKETSSRLFNQDTRLHRIGTMRTMGSRLYQNYSMYVPEAGIMAGRKLYAMLQASSESASQSIRTFEQGRYYGTVAAGVAMAYATRNVGNLKGFEKKAAKSERHNFGFTRNLSDKDISKQLHTRMNESRSAKKDIRSMYERESGLSVEERRALAEKLKDHKAIGKDTAKLVGLQNSRVREKAQREILQELHRNPKGYGLVTENAIKDLKAQRQQIQQQRRAILKGQPERKALNKRLSELQKKGKENLSQAELNEIRDIRGKLSKLSSDPRLKALDRQEQQILKALKKAPDDTAVPLKHIRLKDVQKLRSKILQDHDALERSKFAQFYKVKSSTIQANKKVLEQQSEVAKRKVKALLAKGKRTAGEETELRQLRKLLKKNQADIKAHADILNLRNLRDQKIDALDRIRKALQKNKQRTRMGKMALIGLLTRPLQEADSIGTQGLAKGISMGMNPYVRGLVQSSFRATGRLTAFAAKKVGAWTGLDKTLAPAIDKTKQIYAGARKIANTPREYQRKLVKTAVDATKRAASRMTPQFIKTGNMAVRRTMTNLASRLQKSKLGKAYESVARALSKVKAMLGTAMKAVTAFLGKFLLVFMLVFLLVGLITVIGGGVGGSVPSFLIMGDESSGDKIDLKPYYDVIIDEWDEYLDDLKAKKKSGGYYKLTVNMEPEPANIRNILSMTAVRMNQDLDMDDNKDVEPYLRSLTRDLNPYSAIEGTCYCAGRDCESYPHDEDCPVNCRSRHSYCPGDHKTLTINIKPLYFNEAFYADTSGNANANIAAGGLIGHFKITYYCLENYPHICNDGDSSTTASGTRPKPNYTIATDPSIIETGTPVIIDGKTYMAEDTGGAIKGNRIDIAVATHDEALRLGTRQNVPVYAADYTGEGLQTSEEWNGWVAENREWAKTIYSAPWNELYSGIPNVTDTVGNETDLSGVTFVDGTRPGNQAIVDSALSQLGNVGGQPYWSWYGFDSRVEWCATFVSWCANQQGVLGSAIPRFCSCSLEGVPWFQDRGQWAAARSDYTPVAGDIIFFDWQSDGRPDHVGIVIGSDGSNVYTVEGNSSDAVRTKSYNLNSKFLFGYGLPNY